MEERKLAEQEYFGISDDVDAQTQSDWEFWFFSMRVQHIHCWKEDAAGSYNKSIYILKRADVNDWQMKKISEQGAFGPVRTEPRRDWMPRWDWMPIPEIYIGAVEARYQVYLLWAANHAPDAA